MHDERMIAMRKGEVPEQRDNDVQCMREQCSKVACDDNDAQRQCATTRHGECSATTMRRGNVTSLRGSIATLLHDRNATYSCICNHNNNILLYFFSCNRMPLTCNLRTGHVSGLDLSGYNLKGNLSSSLFQLDQLEHIDLSHNLFIGNFISPHDGKLKRFTFLDLSFAGFVNDFYINECFVNLESLSNLVTFEYLSLDRVNTYGNGKCGEAVGSLPNLQQACFGVGLEDRFPSPLSTPPLSFISIFQTILCHCKNQLENLFSLRSLDLSGTAMEGPIPTAIWNMSSLEHLRLSGTGIKGEIPSVIRNMMSLQILDLSYTNIEGEIPSIIGNVSSLKILNLRDTNIEGQIPLSIVNLSKLWDLELSNNKLTWFSSLSSNNLSGAIPDSIRNSHLNVLDISNNSLSKWGDREDLHTLKLSGSYFTGVIPSSISKCQTLQVLDLGNYNLEGTIPQWIGKLSQLHVLVLRSNHFHGSIPRQVIGLPNLQILDLYGNHLSGPIPSNLTNLLPMVNASQSNPNHLEEDNPTGPTYTNKITISWKGGDAMFVKVLFILKCIDLSNNNLSRGIPPKMRSLQGLIV
ncbi:hypothetical protein SUGI_0870220 [Cryptomeria japonica]|nr:hypothetical protein SUGI_0870220 [Cryptomeria japonica]